MSNHELTTPDQIAVWDRLMDLKEYQRTAPEPLLVARVLPPGRRAAKALDIGCGWGRHLGWLARMGWRVTGLDWSQAAVKHAREALEATGQPAAVIKGDFHRLPFRDGEFQLVVANDVLHHGRVAEFKRALLEIKRVLRIGAQAIISVPSLRNRPQPFIGIWIEENTVVLDNGVEAGLPHHFFSEEEVRRLTQPFREIKIEAEVLPLPPGASPLHAEHVNEWLWITLTG